MITGVVAVSKRRKTVSIDEELADIVDRRDSFNLSGFVNTALETHFAQDSASSAQSAALQAQLEELEAEIEQVEVEKERLRERRERIEERLDEEVNSEPEIMAQARAKLENTPRDADNPAIQNWAAKIGIPPEDLLDELDAPSQSQ